LKECSRSIKIIAVFLPMLNSGLLALTILTYLLTLSIFEALMYFISYVMTSFALAYFTLALPILYGIANDFNKQETLRLSILSLLTIGGICPLKLKEFASGVETKWLVSTIAMSFGFMTSYWMYYLIDKKCVALHIDEFFFSV
jgi:uncharacterized membrane protein